MLAAGADYAFDASIDSSPGDPTNWGFLEDLDFDVGLDSIPSLMAARPQMSSSERLREKNRRAQQRARQKKKERTQSTEAQLSDTIKQLHDLRVRQRQLEARNHLLELAATNKRDGLPPFPSQQKTQIEAREGSLKLLERSGLARKQQGSVLVLTVHDQEEDVLIQDVSKMSPVHVAKLYSAYVCKLAKCLLDVQSNSDHDNSAMAQLRRLSMEVTALFVCFGMGNPKNIGVLHALNMEDGSLSMEPLPYNANGDLLAALDLTAAQQQDMLHLRRCFYSKLGQLSRHRAAIMDSMPAAVQPSHPQPFSLGLKYTAGKLDETREWADTLCANRASESQTFMYAKFCLCRGILTSVQNAQAMVHQYPRGADSKVLMDTLAQQHQEPSTQELTESCELDDTQHAANWQAIVEYVENLDAETLHGHTPLVKVPAKAGIAGAPADLVTNFCTADALIGC